MRLDKTSGTNVELNYDKNNCGKGKNSITFSALARTEVIYVKPETLNMVPLL